MPQMVQLQYDYPPTPDRIPIWLQSYDYQVDKPLDPPEPYQISELQQIFKESVCNELGGSANWNEMGAKKTSTGLWLIQRLVAQLEIENPSILIVTTKSGKGTFFKLAPHILPGYTIFNVNSQGLSIIQQNDKGEQVEIKLPPSKLKYVPEKLDFPCVFIAHYHIFSNSNHGQFELDEEGNPIKNDDGSLKMLEPKQSDHIAKHHWTFAWLDEAHRIKDKDTKWTGSIKRVKADFKHVSTGTGFINRPNEIWSPLNFIDKNAFASYWAFYELFCEIDDSDGYSRIVGVKPEMKDDLRRIVRKYGPRKTLSEVMPHIKEPIFVEREVDLNPVQRKMYDQIKSDLHALDQKGEPIYAANVLSLLQRLRAICVATPEVVSDEYDATQDRRVQKIKLVEPSSKLDDVQEIIEGLEWDEEHKAPVVVFSNFVGPLQLLETRFNNSNIACEEMDLPPEFPYLWLKESDDDNTRYKKWAELFPTLEYRIFMSTLQLGGESISLTDAKHVIFLDRSWSPKDNMQGVGRIRRPGQEGQPVVININARNTTDQYIKAVNNLKHGWFKEIFGDE